MRILDQNNNEIISTVDLRRGHLEIEKIVKAEHPAIEGKEGKGHYDVVKTYDNGGKDVEWVWDEEPVIAQEAWTEYEQIQRYIPYTDDELNELAEQVEAERKAELTPTNSDLSDGAVDLAQGLSDLGDGVTDLADLVAQLDERLSKLEGGN